MRKKAKALAVKYIGKGTLIWGCRNKERLKDAIRDWPKDLSPAPQIEVLIDGECIATLKLEDVKDRDMNQVIKEIGL